MIVYYKLDSLLKQRGISKNKLVQDTGISTNIVSKISKNEGFKTETINRICEYLQTQPGDIMEWIPDDEYAESLQARELAKKEEEKAAIEAQIAKLKKQLEAL